MLLAALVIIGVFVFLSFTAPFWINWLWFGSVGYRSIIVTNYLGVSITFILAGLMAAAVFVTNVRLAVRNTRDQTKPREGRVSRFSQQALNWLGIGGGVVLFFLFGWASRDFWRDAWLALQAKPFGVKDPTFGRDVSFYVFTLPVLKGLQTGLFALIGITMIAVAFVYIVRLGIRFRSWGNVPWAMIRHLSGLGAVLLLLVAFGYLVRNYEMVYSTRGVVIGPGFTDVNIVRPLNWMMAFLSLLAAIGLLSGYVLRNPKWVTALVVGWGFLALILTPLLPVLVQRFIVEPNEFRREEQYIERNVDMTLAGFGLNEVEVTELTGQDPIVPSELSIDETPLSNVRIWDYRVVQPVYQQLQSFVPYYEFGDIDVDWYTIDGKPVQVVASARELNIDGLRETSRTWTNRHLAYTHGYGVVMSPVSQVNSDGWPVMMVSDIPVVGPPSMPVERPEIYFGELPQDWIIINTDQPEFTGIDESVERGGFEGIPAGSISLGNIFTRGLAALTLSDRNVFISGQLTDDSRLVLTRSVVDRAERIAPFFEYDQDPYLIVADGRMYWIIDGYTSSGRFPQATRFEGTNYLRNSVKVVVDAYDGTTTFYRTGLKDPIADAYGKVYGGLFTPISEAPASISSHFRYPEHQFRMQSEVWSTYHVDSARSLYDGDDQWIVAQENVDGAVQTIEPYFVLQKLPNETTDEFALTVPFTPGGGQTRQNMTAWFAGTADASGQTRLRQYRYPRQVTVFGPMQIEAQIDQDPEISQQISLWNQSGTEVIRGNMLVIPVNDAMLYIQPLYLQSRDSAAAAPKLVRVIAATNERVVMRPTLEEAIAALGDESAESVDEIETDVPDEVTEQPADEATPVAPGTTTPSGSSDLAGMTEAELANEALAAWDRAQTALQAGDWATYGEEQERLGQALEALAAMGTTTPTVPEATPSG